MVHLRSGGRKRGPPHDRRARSGCGTEAFCRGTFSSILPASAPQPRHPTPIAGALRKPSSDSQSLPSIPFSTCGGSTCGLERCGPYPSSPLSPLPSHTVLEPPLYNIWQIIMGGGFPTESPVRPQSWTPKASSLVVFILVNICHHRKRRGENASATKTSTLDKIARATFSSPGPGHLAKHFPQGKGVGSPGDRISSELHHRTASNDI
jgi:hypothetical protein